MDVREKLVKQAISHFWYGVSHDIFSEPVTTYAKLAIEALKKENGATLQEWISVKDRLPEQTDPATAVLGITERGRCHIVYYFKGVTSEEFTGFYDICAKRGITHWMPLPQPPKGE
jgi:hypothetical protein